MFNLSAHDSKLKKISILEKKIDLIHEELSNHRVFNMLFNRHNLRIFMEHHVFAVWDFMTILKSLQIKLTCTSLPWQPSMYPKELVRFINSIVLDEESDFDHKKQPCDHFSMYVRAMEEVQANTKDIKRFLKEFDLELLQGPLKDFVDFNINIASNYPIHIIAGVFFFGREKIIPDIFKKILKTMNTTKISYEAPALVHYLKRHIELDEQDHGPLAKHLLLSCCNQDPRLYQEAMSFGIQSCLLRKKLFDAAVEKIEVGTVTQPISRLSKTL